MSMLMILLVTAVIMTCSACTSGNKPAQENSRQEKPAAADKKSISAPKYIDFTALAPDGSEHKLSEYVKPGRYAMIDFWASWCGPCRAAIPHVRGIYSTYNGWLDVISVSLDREEDAWREALEQENMEWTQLWAAGKRMESISQTYQIAGIPYLLLINDKGEIVLAGHDPMQMAETLEKVKGVK